MIRNVNKAIWDAINRDASFLELIDRDTMLFWGKLSGGATFGVICTIMIPVALLLTKSIPKQK